MVRDGVWYLIFRVKAAHVKYKKEEKRTTGRSLFHRWMKKRRLLLPHSSSGDDTNIPSTFFSVFKFKNTK